MDLVRMLNAGKELQRLLPREGDFRPGHKVLVQVKHRKEKKEGILPPKVDFDFLAGRVSVIIDGRMHYPEIQQVELLN